MGLFYYAWLSTNLARTLRGASNPSTWPASEAADVLHRSLEFEKISFLFPLWKK